MKQSAYTNAYRKRLGKFGEQFAASILNDVGLQILARNWRYGRQGELDIVALLSNPEPTIVFIEVKTRTNSSFGTTIESLGFRQQQRLLLLAAAFIQANPQYAQFSQRFDLICVYPDSGIRPEYSEAGHGWCWSHVPDILST